MEDHQANHNEFLRGDGLSHRFLSHSRVAVDVVEFESHLLTEEE